MESITIDANNGKPKPNDRNKVKYHPYCPDCLKTLVKAYIECEDGSGYYCGWLCCCHLPPSVPLPDEIILAGSGKIISTKHLQRNS